MGGGAEIELWFKNSKEDLRKYRIAKLLWLRDLVQQNAMKNVITQS